MPGAPYWGKYIFHDNNRDINYTGYSAQQSAGLSTCSGIRRSCMTCTSRCRSSTPSAARRRRTPASTRSFRRDAVVLQLRDGAADQVRHAGRLDPRLRGRVVAGLRRLHVLQPQRHGSDVRDLRQRRRHHRAAPRQAGPGRRGGLSPRRRRPRANGTGPSPPYQVVEWSMRNNTNYMETGAADRPADDFACSRRSSWRTSTGRAATPSRRAGPRRPTPIVIPGDQAGHDPRRAGGRICCACRGSRSAGPPRPVQLKEGNFPAGSFIVKRDQPYGRLAKILLEKQEFPGQRQAARPMTTRPGPWG